MVTARWHDGTLMKTRLCDGENTMVRTWNNDCTMVKQRLYDGETTKARWWKRDGTMVKDDVTMVKIRWYDMMKLRWHDDENAIIFSLSCHRIIVISPSCHRVLFIIPSYHFNFTFVPLCIAVQGDTNVTNVQTEHRNRLILNDTISWLVSHLAEISRVSLRIPFVDARQEIDSYHIPLSSIPFIVYIKSLKGPLCLRNALYFWYTFIAPKSYSLANYLKHFSSAAFLQLKWFRILYWSQSTSIVYVLLHLWRIISHLSRISLGNKHLTSSEIIIWILINSYLPYLKK
jgi:hypothetical protein